MNPTSSKAEKQEKNPYLQAELFVALRGILNETAAYRKFFATAEEVEGLLKKKEFIPCYNFAWRLL